MRAVCSYSFSPRLLLSDLTPASKMGDEQAICTVINKQFVEEAAYKRDELQRIDDRIQLAKMMLYRLRLGILAQQYGLSGFYLVEDYSQENVGVQASWNNFESDFLSSQQSSQQQEEGEEAGVEKKKLGEDGEREKSVCRKSGEATLEQIKGTCVGIQAPPEAREDRVSTTTSQPPLGVGRKMSLLLNNLRKSSPSADSHASSSTVSTGTPSSGLDSFHHTREPQREAGPAELDSSPSVPARFSTKKRIIVGNTSQFLDPSARSTLDGSSHKWMVYVRGPEKDADITSFVKAVRFFLHPSYHPNDIIRISKPPFHLTRYGWGEFPVRIQLEFSDKCNKHVDILHNLVLDRTHTGHQTLGSETVVDLDLMTTHAESRDSGSGGQSGGATSLKNGAVHPFSATLGDANKGAESTESGGGVTTEGETSRHIHHVFLPAASSVDQVLLDHSYAQIVVVSRRPKALQKVNTTTVERLTVEDAMETSDSEQLDNPDTTQETTLDDVLHSMVKTVPLCGPESHGFHLVSLSVEHFTNWNVGRRRAAEWMRALAVKRVTQMLDPPIPATASLTTRQVVEWCRKNGYTPLDPVVSFSCCGFCKYCGCQLPSSSEETVGASESISHAQCSRSMEALVDDEREEAYYSSDSFDSEQEEEEKGGVKATATRIRQQFSTLSEPFQLFESLTTKAKKLRVLQEQQAREQVVDVLSVPSQKKQVIEAVPRFRIPQTPELKWVQRTAAAIGIRIYPAVIDRMYAHVVEHMIYMACTKLARVIMDRAVTESAQQVEDSSSQERCIVPLHIYRAVESLGSCDFLTNSYMGLPSSTDEPPSSGGADRTE